MRTFVVIPTLYKSPKTLHALIDQLQTEVGVHKVYIYNNTEGNLPIKEGGKVRVFPSPGRTVYEMWNDAKWYINYAFPDKEKNIAFLNDDIAIIPNTMYKLESMLRKYPDVAIVYPDHRTSILLQVEPEIDYTDTTAGGGGMTGYCFMMKGELDIPPVDQNFQLYWGDDDLVKQTIKAGYRVARVNGLPIEHGGSVTIKTLPSGKLTQMMESDRAYFNLKYGENRERVIV